jgi:hypothetical protein
MACGVLVVAGCRSHTAVCDDVDCRSTGSAGAAEVASGAGGIPDNAAGAGAGAGAGGAAVSELECTSDADCMRGTLCDGVETCVEGVCQNGDAPSCEPGTMCLPDSSDGACVYTESSPWILVSYDDRITGLPRHLLGTRDLVTLAERKNNARSSPFLYATWSPSGADALVVTEEFDDGVREARMRFGAGLPAPLAPFAELPNWFPLEQLDNTFAPDGSRLAIHDRFDGSLYLISLEEPPAPTRRFETDIVAFCADPATWLGTAGLVTPVEEELVVQELSGSLTLSPDARWVAQGGVEAALVPCRADAEPVPLGLSANLTWSPSSGFLAAELEDGSLRIMSLADGSQPVVAWTHANAAFRGFSADGASVLVQLPDSERLSFVDLDAAEPNATELLLDPMAYVEMIGPRALLASQYVGEETVQTLFWQPLRALQVPQELVKGSIDNRDAARGAAILRVATEGKLANTLLVRFDRDGFRLDPLAQVNAISFSPDMQMAPDGSGIMQRYDLDARRMMDWFPFDPKTGDVLPRVPLAVGANWAEIQPWH